ncbi:MAG: type IV pilin, partial [Methanomicrobiales archaeon HGW-Methanomicrobiales-4]
MMVRDSAVSSVVGEVLMIALVLILVPMVTISLMNQLPEDRVPTVTIKMGSVSQSG